MSLRYTGEATMDEPLLREVERWKDKIEVRLDNRQVFFLFFGSAMVACMLFVLGVIVGKRLESRGRAVAPLIEDPLAALDRFGSDGATALAAPAALTFPRALLGGGASPIPAKAAKVERAERAVSKVVLANAAPASVPPAPIPSVAPAPAAAPPSASKKLSALPRPLVAGPSPSSATVAAALSAPSKVTVPSVRTTVTAPAPAAKAPAAAAPKPAPAVPVIAARASAAAPTPRAPSVAPPPARAPVAVAPATKTPVAAVAAPKASTLAAAPAKKGGFLLQLPTLQDRAEADALARRFANQNAYVVPTDVPGKGTVYRVRLGSSYGTMKEAAAAKTSFEHDHNQLAYVAGTGPAE